MATQPEIIPAKTLWQATSAAVIIGLLVLVTAILPAQYNIDPTGIGNLLGLTALSPAQLSEAKTADKSESVAGAGEQTVELVIPSQSGLEYKMEMAAGNSLDYQWQTDGERIYFDLHGEPAGDTTGYFKSYTIAKAAKMEGSFIAPFAGSHGWYFKNEGRDTITIKLTINGEFDHARIL